jgi:dipeptidyl aminopeptidase/acylaminoacyl peptidase
MRRSCYRLLLAALVLATPFPATALDGVLAPTDNLVVEGLPPIPLEVVDRVRPYTEIRSASFESWHPQRRELLITTRFGDASQVHLVRHAGGARTQLTFFREPVSNASYDPRDGRSFVFVRDSGGDEFFQLFRFDFESGKSVLLTDGRKRHSLGPWSNAGDRIAFEQVDADAEGAVTALYTVDPREPAGARRLVTLRGGGWDVSDWSPDDSWLVLVERISANESHLWRLDLDSREPKRLTPEPREPGEPKVAWGPGQLSPDGTTLYTTADARGEFRQLAALDVASGTLRLLSEDIPWDVSSFELSPDGRSLAFVTNEAGVSRLYLLDTMAAAAGSVPSAARRAVTALPAGIAGGMEWHRNGSALALTFASARSSGDVYVVDTFSDRVRRWTASETGGLDASLFAEAELVEWQSFDGRAITGFLYRPDASRFPGKRPVIVNIHGGPEGQARPGFLGLANYWLEELGVALLYPNVRGSSGFGKTFLLLDNGFLREGSYEDIRTLFDWVAADDLLDDERVMVTGGSYGGHMTFAVATRYSDRIRCSVPVVGISNLRTFLENTQGYRRDLRRVEYGDERDPEMYAFLERTAPLNHAEKITKPIFIVHGQNDPRVPVSESQQIVGRVRDNGVPAWYLVAKDEGHGFRKRGNRDFQFYGTVLFVERYLLGAGDGQQSSAE